MTLVLTEKQGEEEDVCVGSLQTLFPSEVRLRDPMKRLHNPQ